MAVLDAYLQSQLEHGAGEFHLEGNRPIVFVFDGQPQAMTAEAVHPDTVVALIHEIAPIHVHSRIGLGEPVAFSYPVAGRSFSVRVSPSAGGLLAVFAPEAAAAVPPSVASTEPGTLPGASVGTTGPMTATPLTVTPDAPSADFTLPGMTSQHSGSQGAEEAEPQPAPFAAPAQGAAAVEPRPVRSSAPRIEMPDETGEPAMHALFRRLLALKGSDMHLSCGEPPMFRVSGDMVRAEDLPRLENDALQATLLRIAPQRNREQFHETGDTDFAYELPGEARFRANIFRDRNGVGGVFRVIPHKILSASDLGLPDEVRQLCFLTKGLVLVTGPTGSGKSTTLAALIDHVNAERRDHVITIEDPIEFVHPNKSCLINQREVGVHTRSFQSALRAALREDPDILLVGEMRDLETISIAIETAETGHLVFGTLHTSTAPSTVDRLIDVFPADRQSQIRVMLSESLKGVIAQTLCRKIGGGRVAAYEILLGTGAVSALIREGKTFQIPSVMQTSKKIGMCTLNDSLIDLVRKKLVEPREAYIKAVDKSGLVGLLKSQGLDTSFLAAMGQG